MNSFHEEQNTEKNLCFFSLSKTKLSHLLIHFGKEWSRFYFSFQHLFSTPNLIMYYYIFLWLNNKNIVVVQQKQVIYEKCRYYALNCVYCQ